MKFKIVGWANMILGGFVAIQQILMVFFVIPKMQVLYEGLEVDLPWYSQMMPLISLVVAGIMLGVTGLGMKLAFGKNPSEGLFVAGLVSLFLMLAMGGLFIASSMMSVVGPIYSINSNI